MDKQKWLNVLLVVGVVLALIGATVAVIESQTEYQVMSASGYLFSLQDGTGTTKFSISDAGNTTVAGTFTSNGAADFDSTVNFDALATFVTGLTLSDGDIVVADDLRATAQTAISVTQDATITATGTYQPLESAGTVSTSGIAAGTAGDLLVLINTVATTITISDTGTLKLSGNAALGQYDNVILWSDGTNWIEVSQVDN